MLDEPTEGMDLSARKLLHEIILRRKSAGQDGDARLAQHGRRRPACDELAVLRGGRVVFRGPLADLAGEGPQPRRCRFACRRPSSPSTQEPHHERSATLVSVIFRLVKDTFRQSMAAGICWLLLGAEHDLHPGLPERERQRPADR